MYSLTSGSEPSAAFNCATSAAFCVDVFLFENGYLAVRGMRAGTYQAAFPLRFTTALPFLVFSPLPLDLPDPPRLPRHCYWGRVASRFRVFWWLRPH